MHNIRSILKNELQQLANLYKHLNSDTYGQNLQNLNASYDQLISIIGSQILVCSLDNEIIGSCSVIIVPNLSRGARPFCLIENVVTHRDHRKQGIGRALLDRATQIAWEQECYKVMLLTGSEDPATLDFYSGAGFIQSKTGFQKRNYLSERQIQHVMRPQL